MSRVVLKPNILFICMAIRRQPKRGLRCFMDITACINSLVGPRGPGLRFNLLENINLTDEVLPTCDFIINYSLNRSEKMTNLWDNKRKDYLNKTLTYRLLVFNKVY